jgi:hypothetical protein
MLASRTAFNSLSPPRYQTRDPSNSSKVTVHAKPATPKRQRRGRITARRPDKPPFTHPAGHGIALARTSLHAAARRLPNRDHLRTCTEDRIRQSGVEEMST